MSSENPLLSRWSGPHGGVPPFASVAIAHFVPALEQAMENKKKDVEAIARDAAPPTFDNTVLALEDAGRTYEDVRMIFDVWSSSMNTPEFQRIELEMAPRLSAFDDAIAHDARIFARLEAVYLDPATKALPAEAQRLVWRHYNALVRSGVKLDAAAKASVVAINAELASLYTRFAQNVLADEDDAVVVDAEADLEGLPPAYVASAARAAADRGHAGRWAIENTRSAVEPALTYAARGDLRRAVWERFVRRGDNGGEHDNKAIITRILRLRADRAAALGYATHAHYRLENGMAKTPERAMELMTEVWPRAVARVREDVRAMQVLADASPDPRPIAPWDYRYYAEKVRKARYDIDEQAVKPYLQLEKLREGMFWVADRLLGFVFQPRTDIEVFHPDVRVWEVTDRTSGRHVGLWYFDPYARPGKQSGAWMNGYRPQERFRKEVTPIVSNNSNFVKAEGGAPLTVSWTDAQTLFHEFGHALHGLASNVTYPTLAGTRVARDYVEFPSQLFEHWLSTPEVLERFAIHHETGAPIPMDLVRKIAAAQTFNQGFETVEYLSAALFDMKVHLAGAVDVDPAAFEKATLDTLGMPSEIVMRHRPPQFGHVFASDGYSAGYYSYLWADTLSADAFEAFTEGAGPFDLDVAARLRTHVLEAGDTVDPAVGYRAFRGRDPGTGALMRKRGLLAETVGP